MRIFALYSIKGGVGKTATAVNLAHLSAASGARTLLWDLDPQGAATFQFRVEPKVKGGVKKLLRGRRPVERNLRGTDFDGLDLLPADFSYRKLDLVLDASGRPRKRLGRLLGPVAASYDHVFIDCAPSITLASESVFAAVDVLLVPTVPTTLSLRTLEQLRDHLSKRGPKRLEVLPFFSMVDRRKALHREVCERRDHAGFSFLEARIPYSSTVEQMSAHRLPVGVFAPTSDAAGAYRELWREALTRTGSFRGWFEDPSYRFRPF